MTNEPVAEFDQYAADYKALVDDSVTLSGESSEYFAAYKAAYLRRRLGDFRGTMLDYGCGVGLLANCIRQALPAARLDGYDPSPESIMHMDAVTRAQGMFTSDLIALRARYQVIILANVIHHVEVGGRQKLISFLATRLEHGGTMFIFEHNPRNPLTRRAVKKCVLDRGVTLAPAGEIRHYLSNSGLRGLHVDYIVFFPRLLAWLRPLERHMAKLSLGAQYVFSAEAAPE